MMKHENPKSVFPSAEEDVDAARLMPDTPQTRSHSYRLAYTDSDFLLHALRYSVKKKS